MGRMVQRTKTWKARWDEKRRRTRIEDMNQYITCRQFKFWRRGMVIGFIILFLGAMSNSYVDRERSRVARATLVHSSRVVVIDGCNRDFRTIERLRALLVRAELAVNQQRKEGIISQRRYETALKFYDEEIRLLRLPDCRRAQNVITADPFRDVPKPPFPLYPGSPLSTPEPERPKG